MSKQKSIKDMIFEELESETCNDAYILSFSDSYMNFNKGIL